jgi:carbamoyltransferase
MAIILGINAYHGDSSACLLCDGQLIAASEEERFRRIKHWAGFPTQAIRYCLNEAKLDITSIDHIAVNRNPKANMWQKIVFMLRHRPDIALVKDRLRNATKVRGIQDAFVDEFDVEPEKLSAKIHHVEHHIAHLASAFLVSPYDRAAVVSVDGAGDFVGCMWGMGTHNHIEVAQRIFSPHSLGLLYLIITQYLGFPKYGDEYKVMGLAAFGTSSERAKMSKLVHILPGGRFALDLRYFLHNRKGGAMTWNAEEPQLPLLFSEALETLLGPARLPEETISTRHQNIAASLQAMYETVFFHILNHVYKLTKVPTLCLAGGCAMNSVANGKIFDNTPFQEVFIQPAAGDAGGAVGAAYYVWNQLLAYPRSFVMKHSYWGEAFTDSAISELLNANKIQLSDAGCLIEKIEDESALCKRTARAISTGKVVGWFQGRMEWGARALGNRSILADPRRAEMKDILNERIKKRETFRPFAPSILLEKVDEFFEIAYPDPFMIKVYPIKEEKRPFIPAVTHIDGTGRLQTVRRDDNPLYWMLIKEFEALTGIPILLNTSFNENEPIVRDPSEALDCFLRTKMDILVLGHYVITR